jgi:AbrB family looped-hinge helix DNA binding protein
MTYIAKVSQKGWIVIPADLRRRYGIEPGAEVKIAPRARGMEVMPVMKDAIRETAGKYRTVKPTLLESLLSERQKEKEREDRRGGR